MSSCCSAKYGDLLVSKGVNSWSVEVIISDLSVSDLSYNIDGCGKKNDAWKCGGTFSLLCNVCCWRFRTSPAPAAFQSCNHTGWMTEIIPPLFHNWIIIIPSFASLHHRFTMTIPLLCPHDTTLYHHYTNQRPWSAATCCWTATWMKPAEQQETSLNSDAADQQQTVAEQQLAWNLLISRNLLLNSNLLETCWAAGNITEQRRCWSAVKIQSWTFNPEQHCSTLPLCSS